MPIVCGNSAFVFVLFCISLCPFEFCNNLEEEERGEGGGLLLCYFCLTDVLLP